MISIKRVFSEEGHGQIRLCASISIDGNDYCLWLSVDKKNSDALCRDRADGFIAGLLPLAIREHHDIVSCVPVTDLLIDSIKHDFIDVVTQQEPSIYKVSIDAPLIKPIYKTKTVHATGLSCGVDCFYTVKNRILAAGGDGKVFVLSNSHPRGVGQTKDQTEDQFNYLIKNAKAVSDELGIELLVVDTNYASGEVPGLTIINYTTFCNAFCALCLQKRFSVYYLASGGPIADFGLKYLKNGMFRTDCSNYDLITVQALSIPGLKFIVDGLEWRMDKIRRLVDWDVFQNHFDTCFFHPPHQKANGTYDCEKCMHSINEIMAVVGKKGMAKFGNVIDVEYVWSHMSEYLAYLIVQRLKRTEVGVDVWRHRRNSGFCCQDYVLAVFVIIRKCATKVLRKVGLIKSRPTKWVEI